MHGHYHSLNSPNGMSFPWKLVCHLKVPPRVAIFACTTALGKILSTDYVWKRGIIVVDWCVCLVFNGLCHKGFSIC